MPVSTALVRERETADCHLYQPGILEVHCEHSRYEIGDGSGISTSLQRELLI